MLSTTLETTLKDLMKTMIILLLTFFQAYLYLSNQYVTHIFYNYCSDYGNMSSYIYVNVDIFTKLGLY